MRTIQEYFSGYDWPDLDEVEASYINALDTVSRIALDINRECSIDFDALGSALRSLAEAKQNLDDTLYIDDIDDMVTVHGEVNTCEGRKDGRFYEGATEMCKDEEDVISLDIDEKAKVATLTVNGKSTTAKVMGYNEYIDPETAEVMLDSEVEDAGAGWMNELFAEGITFRYDDEGQDFILKVDMAQHPSLQGAFKSV